MLRMQQIRKYQGITAKSLSELSGIGIGTINAWENGASRINKLADFITLAEVLGCSISDLIDDESLRDRFDTLTGKSPEPVASEPQSLSPEPQSPEPVPPQSPSSASEPTADMLDKLRALKALLEMV